MTSSPGMAGGGRKKVRQAMSNELQTIETGAPVSFDEMRSMMADLEKFIADLLKDGLDHGVIPGTKKPTLYKAGAEKLCGAFNLTPQYEVTDKTVESLREWTAIINGKEVRQVGFYRYEIKCTLINRRSGVVWADCIASCESTERGRENAPSNTILKMAQKRSLVGATLNATFTSGRFLQDIEDYKEDQSVVQNGNDDTIPLGKHKGQKYSELPSEYLKWIVEKSDLDDNIKTPAKAALEQKKTKKVKQTEEETTTEPETDEEYICQLESKLAKQLGQQIPEIRMTGLGQMDLMSADKKALQEYKQLLKQQLN